MKRSCVFFVYLPALILAGLLLLAMPFAAQARDTFGRFKPSNDCPCIYVTGNVVKPQALAFKGPLPITQAITMAGGLERHAMKDQVRIIRTDPAGSLEPIIIAVNLNAIKKHRAPDVLLQVYDIVDVAGERSTTSQITLIPARVIH